MKRFLTLLLLCTSPMAFSATGAQETFTTAGVADCSAVTYCTQTTEDGLFTLKYDVTTPLSGPSDRGFIVYAPSIEITNANGGLMNLNIMSASVMAASNINGPSSFGGIRLEVQNANGEWKTATQWNRYVGTGFYIMFNGHTPMRGPLVREVKAIRFVAAAGTTSFNLGMLHLTAF